MTDDPFERAAEREQELRRERYRKIYDDMRGGSWPFFAVWAGFLGLQYALFGGGVLFVLHACVFALFAVMLLAPFLIPSALWAPLLFAHYAVSGWTTLAKVHAYVFLMFLVLFVALTVTEWREDRAERRSARRNTVGIF